MQPLLAEAGGWCGAFDGSPLAACADNPKVGRWHYVRRFLGFGFDSLTSDADIAWVRDPLPYLGALLALHPATDVLSSTDANDGHYQAATQPDGTQGYSVVRSTATRAAGEAPPPPATRRWEAVFPAFPLAPQHGVVLRSPEYEGLDERSGINGLLAQLRRGGQPQEEMDLGLEEITNCGACLCCAPVLASASISPEHAPLRQVASSTRASCCGAPRRRPWRCSTAAGSS